ncbi:MAG: FkbM family methyltransferase [Candidatus Binataceae bacterium]|nr:FkbM family methyltransferase [Candidatus Binataceae bacterium]
MHGEGKLTDVSTMINWSAIDHRSLAGRLVRLPARLLPARTVMRVRRGPARGLKWIAGSATHGCWLGTYELEKQATLLRFVSPGMTIYDIGAQAGIYTLFFSKLSGASGRVYAFEPCPYEARFLVDHVRMNGLANVKIIQAAVAERTGFVGISTGRGSCQNQICDDAATALMVPCINLDTLDLPSPDLIKIDVEGAESAVLAGAHRVLRETRPVIFVALHSIEQRAKCAALLRAARYVVYDLKGQPVDGVPSGDEIYATPQP